MLEKYHNHARNVGPNNINSPGLP